MNRNAIILALIVGFGVYIWKDGEDTDARPMATAVDSQSTNATQNDAQVQRYLEDARRERERIEQLKEDMEVESLNAELDRRIERQQSREQLERAQQQARRERQQQEWKQDFNDRADRREAWEDYNASKDAVSEVTNNDHWNLSPPSRDINFSQELPKQQLRRRYGDAATLEQNELD